MASMAMAEQTSKDRLSDLPIRIIHHIFGMLDAAHAVQVSILSKRWRHVWRSLPFLMFLYHSSYAPSYTTTSFVNFVNKVLMLRDQSAVITTFSIFCEDPPMTPFITSHTIHSWLLVAIRCNVQTLKIELRPKEQIQIHLPTSLFTCKSLVRMDLYFTYLVLPSFTQLPILEFLSIHYSTLMDDQATSSIVLSCPSLWQMCIEDRGVRSRSLNNLANLVIDAPKLEGICMTKLFVDDALDNSMEINVLAPNLRFLTCDDAFMTRKLSFGNLSHMYHACFTVMADYEKDYPFLTMKNINGHRAIEAVCPHTKFLTLQGLAVEAFFGSPKVWKNASLRFHNLEYLYLCIRITSSRVVAIKHLLKLCPNVATINLVFDGQLIFDEEKRARSSDFFISKDPVLQHLRFLRIEGIMGTTHDLKLLKFVFKNAVVLEDVDLHRCESALPYMLGQFLKKLNQIRPSSIPLISIDWLS